jgi:hypothetical protein
MATEKFLRIPGSDWRVVFQLYEQTERFRDSWAASMSSRDLAIDRMRSNWSCLRQSSYCQVILVEPRPVDAPANFYGLHWGGMLTRHSLKTGEARHERRQNCEHEVAGYVSDE